MYQTNCQAYLAIDKFLRTTSRPEIPVKFPWSDIYNKIYFISYDYFKQITC